MWHGNLQHVQRGGVNMHRKYPTHPREARQRMCKRVRNQSPGPLCAPPPTGTAPSGQKVWVVGTGISPRNSTAKFFPSAMAFPLCGTEVLHVDPLYETKAGKLVCMQTGACANITGH